jgi:sarcosine oxidase delta subunit
LAAKILHSWRKTSFCRQFFSPNRITLLTCIQTMYSLKGGLGSEKHDAWFNVFCTR